MSSFVQFVLHTNGILEGRRKMRIEQTFFVSRPPEVVFDYLTRPGEP